MAPCDRRKSALCIAGLVMAGAAEVAAGSANITRLLSQVVDPLARCGPCDGPADWKRCEFWGDPHFRKSFYGEKFNYQGKGVHHVASACDGAFVIQDFQCPWRRDKRAAVAVGVAIKVGGDVIYMSDKEVTVNGQPASKNTPPGVHFDGDLEHFPGIKLTTANKCFGINVMRQARDHFKSPTFLYNVKLAISGAITQKEGLCGADNARGRHYIPNESPEMLFTLAQIADLCRACDLPPGYPGTPLNCLSVKERERQMEDAWKCKKLTSVQKGQRTTKRFWKTQCMNLPRTTKMLAMRHTAPAPTDLFRPKRGVDFCTMLTSNRKHTWSLDGLSWRTPSYASRRTNILGGCKKGWPKFQGDVRERLTVWGPTARSNFDVYYCEGTPPGAEEAEGPTSKEACAQAGIPLRAAKKVCMGVQKFAFDMEGCMMDYCIGGGDKTAGINAVEAEFSDPWDKSKIPSPFGNSEGSPSRNSKEADRPRRGPPPPSPRPRRPQPPRPRRPQGLKRKANPPPPPLPTATAPPLAQSGPAPPVAPVPLPAQDTPQANPQPPSLPTATAPPLAQGVPQMESMPKSANAATTAGNQAALSNLIGRFRRRARGHGRAGDDQGDSESPTTWTGAAAMAAACLGCAAAAAAAMAAPWVAWRRRARDLPQLEEAECLVGPDSTEREAFMPLE